MPAGKDQVIYASNNDALQVIPNPNNGVFKVIKNKTTESENFHLTIFDMKGAVIFEADDFTSQDVDLTNFSAGIYMVQVTSNSGYHDAKKISINK
jgi:hypothetical protein